MANLAARLERLERAMPARNVVSYDATKWDFYGGPCECGLDVGQCRIHPRARASQRAPGGSWNKNLFLGGRGSGKSRAGAEWVRNMVETGQARRIALVGPTAADTRDVMVLGESGLLNVCPPWNRPEYKPSLGRLTWPNGAVALAYSAERPDRLRGPNFDAAWCDEVAAWDNGQECYDMLSFALRIGANPRVFLSSTPRATKFLKALVAEPGMRLSKDSTYSNRAHLAPSFFSEIISRYEGSRLGRQELEAEILEVGEGAYFEHFSDERNVTDKAEFRPGLPVYLSVDAGASRTTAGVFCQVLDRDKFRKIVICWGDYVAVDQMSVDNAEALKELAQQLPCKGLVDKVLLDPSTSAQTSLGPRARAEYELVWGSRTVDAWPLKRVIDSLEQLEIAVGSPRREADLYIHPRCTQLTQAMKEYRHAMKRGEVLDGPEAGQHPAGDLVDSVRGFLGFAMPEGHRPAFKPHKWKNVKDVF